MATLSLQDAVQSGDRSSLDELQQQRIARRCIAVLPLVIRAGGREYVGVSRDIGGGGMFFYSVLNPAVGSEIEVVIKASEFDPRVTAACRCLVIRVEPHRAGAATGIGVAITSYQGLEDDVETAAQPAAAYDIC